MRDAGPSAKTAGRRLHAADTAKGVGIIFVVFGHAWRGAFDAGLLSDRALFAVIDTAIYAWHMPLFFLLSGLMALEALQRTAPPMFLSQRARRLLWPMALWTWIFFGVKLLAGDAANHPVVWAEFPLVPLPPYEHLWFLWALMLVQMAVMALWLILRPVMDVSRMRMVFGGGALVCALLIPFLYLPSPIFGAAVQHFPFFIAGIALGGLGHLRPPLWLAAVAAVGFAALLYGIAGQQAPLIVSLALTVLACVVFAAMDDNTDQPGPVIAGLRKLGIYSLAIFLAHTIFAAGFRIGLLAMGMDALWLHLVTATAVGLLAPIALVHLSRRAGLDRMLGF